MQEGVLTERHSLARRGKRLEYFTIGWNTLEGIIAVIAGALAGSISLVGTENPAPKPASKSCIWRLW